jgi:hypothetical protein
MWPINMPGQTARDTYLMCINRIRCLPLKKRMEDLEEEVATAAKRYTDAARSAMLYTMRGADFTPESPQDARELMNTYTSRMAKERAPGRHVYDQLILARKRCPLCNHRDVSTLDHHLPKTRYPLLSVTPVNLIPACSDCNKTKSDVSPVTPGDQSLHPYFDNIDQDTWLKAEVVQGTPPALVFYADPSPHWTAGLSNRVRHHFELFGLANLYGSQAAAELAEIAYQLRQIHEDGGDQAVKAHLDLTALSRSRVNRNHWRSATYRALADSHWYYSGGFAFT